MLAKALRHCDARFGVVFRYENGTFRGVAGIGIPESILAKWEQDASNPASDLQSLITSRQPKYTVDLRNNPSYLAGDPFAVGAVERGGARSALLVPLVKDDALIGVFAIYRQEVLPFTDKQVQLVSTFADQAVIAIENARLFEAEQSSRQKLQEALEYQTATSEVLGVIGRSKFDVQPVLEAIVETASRLCQAGNIYLWKLKDGKYHPIAYKTDEPDFLQYLKDNPIQPDQRGSVTARAARQQRTIHVPDALADPERDTGPLRASGGRTVLSVPLVREGLTLGVITMDRRVVMPFDDGQIELIETFADQAVIAIENTRLFEEVQARTRELAKTVEDLEIASMHKSQFVANMSHELRTPLAAILGYAELIQEGFYGPLPEKSLDALARVRSNGKHLLGLINTVLDIAKIESGQFSLNLGEYALENVVETVCAATESLAEAKKLALKAEVARRLPVGLGDEQRLTQVLLNLVGNAIKFTDAGEVRISAAAKDGQFAVSVTDTGPGIPQDEQARIFEQFHQVDSSNTKAKGGTGLGLAIAKEIVEMHGGRIWVESTLGKGATFQLELPIRPERRKATA
jgi:signal transduction histidine kinase